jgi:general secretion pathway protein G
MPHRTHSTAFPTASRRERQCAVRAAGRRRAFTLVEILIVLGILSLLAAIIIPIIGSVRAAGRRSVCISNLQQLGHAIALYAQDYDRYPRGLDPTDKYTPEIWNGIPAAEGDVLATTPLLPDVIMTYVKPASLWQCPADTGFDVADITGYPLDARPSCYEKFGMSYLYRSELTLLDLSQEHLPRPAETNVLADADGLWHGSSSLFSSARRYNVLFGDGHVKNVEGETYLQMWDIPIK